MDFARSQVIYLCKSKKIRVKKVILPFYKIAYLFTTYRTFQDNNWKHIGVVPWEFSVEFNDK